MTSNVSNNGDDGDDDDDGDDALLLHTSTTSYRDVDDNDDPRSNPLFIIVSSIDAKRSPRHRRRLDGRWIRSRIVVVVNVVD